MNANSTGGHACVQASLRGALITKFCHLLQSIMATIGGGQAKLYSCIVRDSIHRSSSLFKYYKLYFGGYSQPHAYICAFKVTAPSTTANVLVQKG